MSGKGSAANDIHPEPPMTDPDDVPEPPDEATTKPGDLWILGDYAMPQVRRQCDSVIKRS